MAQITVTKILDGPRNAVFHVAIEGDGSGDLTDEVVIDPTSSFDPALPADPLLSVTHLWYDLTGFSAKLEFDFLVSDTPVWTIAPDQCGAQDFTLFGGVKDRSGDLDGSGKLTLTTKDLGANDRGTIIVQVKKQ